MTARQKTFSIALSRDMAPSARILVWYLRPDGEVVTDALNFYVNGTQMFPVGGIEYCAQAQKKKNCLVGLVSACPAVTGGE